MSDEPREPAGSDEASGEGGGLPRARVAAREAVVLDRARTSVVWIVPLVAALVGIFLAYVSYTEKGPTIYITFDRAEGLEAGTTKVKYKEVDIGEIKAVELTEDLSKVFVTAELVSGSQRYLTENTRFWVVRAEVSAGQISGLGTVLSGAYVAIDPSTEGRSRRYFTGLEKAPVVTSDEDGTTFQLRSDSLGSMDVGSPVYYRWLRVGQIAGYELEEEGEGVRLQVFIESPHDRRVRSTTRFWNASGFDATITTQGIQIDTPSLISLALGGIAFDTPTTFDVARDVPEDMVFELYPNRQASRQPRYSFKARYLVQFDQSIAGLAPGSPVEYRGIKIGEVKDIDLEFELESQQIRMPVVIEIEPERLGIAAPAEGEDGGRAIEALVARGLRARLATANMITGLKAVELAFVENAAPATIGGDAQYPELPTARGDLDAITTQVARIVDRVDQIPIESIGTNLDEMLERMERTLGEMQGLAESANRDLMPTLTASIERLQQTLSAAEGAIAPDSPMAQEIGTLLEDLSEAARSIRMLAERLEQHPEELLRGKSR